MDRTTLNNAKNDIEFLADKLGEIVFDEINADDNFTCEIGKQIIFTFNQCKTEKEFQVANDMLIAICGWSFDTVVDKIKKLDAEDFYWESIG